MYNEEEQIEAIKDWWRANGNSILIALLVAVLASVGWRWWNNHNTNISLGASSAYSEMTQLMDEQLNNPSAAGRAAVQTQAEQLIADYGKTGYASFAYLTLAQVAVQEEEYEQAVEQLEKLLAAKPDKEVEAIARIRLARLQLQLNNPDAALAALDKKLAQAWQSRVLELRGDAYQQQASAEQAREAYTQALQAATAQDSARNRLQMKIDNLAPTS
ncbi:MAG TPA: tetratricopeptide repeat protein [Alcanivoracaceae bacterium]|nr:tetratricopeptide repeat protein [Alcanivoracaceae bacterium]